MGLSGAVPVLSTQATVPPDRVSWWCRAPPAHSAHRARATRGETACGAPVHRHPSPSRAGPVHATRRASPGTGRGAFDNVWLVARGMLGVVARLVPTPQTGTSGSRARHGHGDWRSP